MYKKLPLAVLVTAALLLVAPAIATATGTSTPNLPAGVDPACIIDGDGNCEEVTAELEGQLVVTAIAGLAITCNVEESITFHEDGTSQVTAFTATGCTTNPNACPPDFPAVNLPWGDRLGYDTGSSTYRDYTNTSILVQLTSGCFITGAFPANGVLAPTINISGGVLTATYDSGSGTVSGPLGSARVHGTLTSTSGIGADTQLYPY